MEWLSTGPGDFPGHARKPSARRANRSCWKPTFLPTGKSGRLFLAALVAARQRGVQVRVLVDAMGSWLLPDDFFQPLIAAGGTMRWFNPLRPWRFGVRNHRKLLVCDKQVAFLGGFNIADEYNGDGVTSGWCDLGARLVNPALAGQLVAAFNQLFELADFHRRPLLRLRVFQRLRVADGFAGRRIAAGNPGARRGEIQRALRRDLAHAREVDIISAYFLPPWRLRRDLAPGGAARRAGAAHPGGQVGRAAGATGRAQPLPSAGAGAAWRSTREYQPQILHAKAHHH